jgi:16S rRNA (adenine1518-N6/adenine1519-N6)-dimethyltransferase
LQQPFVEQADGSLLFADQRFIPEQTLVVGNLPYYITSPILRLFFCTHRRFPAGVFLIQEEVAQKIRRDAKKKSYLRWLVNRTHRVRYAFTVKAGSFSPPPKVTSAVIIVEKTA